MGGTALRSSPIIPPPPPVPEEDWTIACFRHGTQSHRLVKTNKHPRRALLPVQSVFPKLHFLQNSNARGHYDEVVGQNSTLEMTYQLIIVSYCEAPKLHTDSVFYALPPPRQSQAYSFRSKHDRCRRAERAWRLTTTTTGFAYSQVVLLPQNKLGYIFRFSEFLVLPSILFHLRSVFLLFSSCIFISFLALERSAGL